MYITVKTIKRNMGFKGIEIEDFIIGIPIALIFIIMFCCTPFKIASIVFLLIGAFSLLPISVSKKNRMYKVIWLIIKYLFKPKKYVYERRKSIGNEEQIM